MTEENGLQVVKISRTQRKAIGTIKRRLTIMLVIGICASIYLLYTGISQILYYNSVNYGNMLDYFIAGYLPILVALLILISLVVTMLRGTSRISAFYR
jgi:hypothetical protein